ncbi:MAG: rod shape-determining protein MreC [Candidatus Uhrbacteria bacterium]|nr:rod shape-determining protein MreC [Candidatus Uhrbacteria bacterium]
MRTALYYSILILCILAIEFTSLFSPIEKLGAYISTIARPQNEQVQGQCDSCTTDSVRLHLLEEENAQLRDQLKFVERTKQSPLVGKRIGRSTDPFQLEIIINKGERDGVRVGDPVIARDGILVGTIRSTEQTKSYVLALTDPRSKILSTIFQEKKEIHGITEGQFSTGLVMTLVPIAEELRKDDLVVTSGLQDAIPAGLVIGTVQDIIKKPEDLFQSAILRSALLLDDLAILSVLIRGEK